MKIENHLNFNYRRDIPRGPALRSDSSADLSAIALATAEASAARRKLRATDGPVPLSEDNASFISAQSSALEVAVPTGKKQSAPLPAPPRAVFEAGAPTVRQSKEVKFRNLIEALGITCY